MCQQRLKAFGVPHEVPRSACVFCPYRSNEEWRWLRDNDPAGFQRAVEIDVALRTPGNVVNRNLEQQLYVHRSCVPLAEAFLEKHGIISGPDVPGLLPGMQRSVRKLKPSTL